MKSITKLCCLVSGALLIAFAGCTDATSATEDSEGVGEVNLALTTVPTGVQCIQIVAKGTTTVTKTFTVTAGSSGVNVLALGALPVGSVAISGQAYNVACASISGQTPTWIADNFTINVQSGVTTSPTITFRPNNTVTATANFVGNVVQVATNQYVIDVLYSDGTVRGAGYQAALGRGQLTTFASLPGLTNVASLALGAYDFGCAVLKSGTVSCFGANNVGQLGNGTTNSSTTPVAVSGLTNVVRLSAGGYHACALKSDGTLWCWGGNDSGQVGNGSTTNVTSPVQVMTGVSYVAAGWLDTCALQSGQVWCWGKNDYGQLGLGYTQSPITSPTSITPFRQPPPITAVTQIVAGAMHTCALRADGDVFCWGYGGVGQLGYGSTGQLLAPIATPVLASVQQLSTSDYSTCAKLNDGHVMCWGQDALGALGDGTGTYPGINTPTSVLSNNVTFTSIFLASSGPTFCSLGSDLKIYCWGGNDFNQFGNGSLSTAWVPTALGI